MAKRKLNAQDVPEEPAQLTTNGTNESSPATPTATSTAPAKTTAKKAASPVAASFQDLGLEPRLLRAIRDNRWSAPTQVQATVIPLVLEGKDVMMRSGTGTGKTAAFLLPIMHDILERKKGQTCLILAPTKELANQLKAVAQSLSAHLTADIRVRNISGKESDAVTKAALADRPEIVIATPSRAWANVNSGALDVSTLGALVLDEADLTMAYGGEADIRALSEVIPGGVQTILVSATLNTEVESLGGLLCSNPVVIKLDDLDKNAQKVKQYVLKVAEEEKCKYCNRQ
jgi:ATP-dependent RNA helicase DDX56/DBP9